MNWEKEVMSYVKGISAEVCRGKYIDISIEVEPQIFKLLGEKELGKIDEFHYLKNKFGNFYLTADGICWFWAITDKTVNSRIKNKVGRYTLMDTDTATKMPNTKQFRVFKKLIENKLNEELERFYNESL